MTMLMNQNGSHVRRSFTTKEAFRALRVAVVPVYVPELKDNPDDPEEESPVVYMRAMTDAEKEEWQLRNIADQHFEPDPEKARENDRQKTYRQVLARNRPDLISMCIVDEDGRRIFSIEDVEDLANLNAGAVARLYAKARELCGLDAPKPAPEELLGNSPAGRSGS